MRYCEGLDSLKARGCRQLIVPGSLGREVGGHYGCRAAFDLGRQDVYSGV